VIGVGVADVGEDAESALPQAYRRRVVAETLVDSCQAGEGLADVVPVSELVEEVEAPLVGSNALVVIACVLVREAEAVPRLGLAHHVGFVLVQGESLAAAEHGHLVGAEVSVATADRVEGVRAIRCETGTEAEIQGALGMCHRLVVTAA